MKETSILEKVITRGRCMMLLRTLHFSEPTVTPNEILYKIRSATDHLCEQFKYAFTPLPHSKTYALMNH